MKKPVSDEDEILIRSYDLKGNLKLERFGPGLVVTWRIKTPQGVVESSDYLPGNSFGRLVQRLQEMYKSASAVKELENTDMDSKWRTLVRVEEVTEQQLKVVFPGWSAELVSLPVYSIPKEVLDKVKEGQVYFHAQTHLGAEDPQDLNPTDWELE